MFIAAVAVVAVGGGGVDVVVGVCGVVGVVVGVICLCWMFVAVVIVGVSVCCWRWWYLVLSLLMLLMPLTASVHGSGRSDQRLLSVSYRAAPISSRMWRSHLGDCMSPLRTAVSNFYPVKRRHSTSDMVLL